ncbi:hypothetical protein KDJ21_005490 [Metabacillus litoralis]|uniref:hypothetical protein n=1 Tax=Metabacillus TaxID=2675233 RepID=UPI001B923630|nr:hypothetical protein [Metabacillus litoralis]UHA61117.1 hypothetical protein KDJ21_005490 [Metabacillus litoralis]
MGRIREEDFLYSLIEYLETEGEHEILRLLDRCELSFDYTSQFTRIKWNQCSVYLQIRIPINTKKEIERKKKELEKACMALFPDDDDYALMGISFGLLISKANGNIEEKQTDEVNLPSRNQVYENLITKLNKTNLDSIEKDYLYEACLCARKGYNLSASTMLGCAAERMLLLLCKAYLKYLKNGNGSVKEISNFENNVLNAKKAHARLDGFIKSVTNKEKLFEELGLENSNLHFSFLDIIRQVRNESGHPTGVKITSEDLNTIFGNYQLLIERVHPLLTKLPLIMPE